MDLQFANEIGVLDAHGQAELVRSGQVSAQELVAAAIARIESLEPRLNAVSYRAFDRAMERARSGTSSRAAEFFGVPYLIKDSLDYVGMPSRCASRSFPDTPVFKQYEFISRFDAAGLIPLGKTNMPELALMPTSESLLYGTSVNPWDTQYSSGGSSGGAAAVVASGMVPLAQAGDGGGSIRIPASCCGTLGLKTSRGANARARAWHFVEDMLTSDSMISRSVRDLAWAYKTASSGCLPPGWFEQVRRPPRRLRIGVQMRNLVGELPSADVRMVIRRTMRLLDELGHGVEECEWPSGIDQALAAFKTLWMYVAEDAVARLPRSRACIEDALEPWTRHLAAAVRTIDLKETEVVWRQIGALARILDDVFSRFDVVAGPEERAR